MAPVRHPHVSIDVDEHAAECPQDFLRPLTRGVLRTSRGTQPTHLTRPRDRIRASSRSDPGEWRILECDISQLSASQLERQSAIQCRDPRATAVTSLTAKSWRT